MEEKENKDKNKNLNCLGLIILGLIIIAIMSGVSNFLRENTGFSIVLSILFTIWLCWRLSK